jgi:hypothetical protein
MKKVELSPCNCSSPTSAVFPPLALCRPLRAPSSFLVSPSNMRGTRFLANMSRMRTYENLGRKSRRICTCTRKNLKPFKIRTYIKPPGGMPSLSELYSTGQDVSTLESQRLRKSVLNSFRMTTFTKNIGGRGRFAHFACQINSVRFLTAGIIQLKATNKSVYVHA